MFLPVKVEQLALSTGPSFSYHMQRAWSETKIALRPYCRRRRALTSYQLCQVDACFREALRREGAAGRAPCSRSRILSGQLVLEKSIPAAPKRCSAETVWGLGACGCRQNGGNSPAGSPYRGLVGSPFAATIWCPGALGEVNLAHSARALQAYQSIRPCHSPAQQPSSTTTWAAGPGCEW